MNLVPILPSSETSISDGSTSTSPNGTIVFVGVPFCIVLIEILSGIVSSLVLTKTSPPVMNIPSLDAIVPSSNFLFLGTKNDCANGSPSSTSSTVTVVVPSIIFSLNLDTVCSPVWTLSTSAVLNERICSCVVWLNPVAL